MRFQNLLSLLFVLFSTSLWSQQNYSVQLHSGNLTFPENVAENLERGTIADYELVTNKYYRFIQFYEIPNKSTHQKLKELKIELLEYISNKAYIASIPANFNLEKLEELGVRSFLEISPDLKLADNLKVSEFPDWATHRSQIRLMMKYYKNIPQEQIKEYCLHDGIQVLKSNNYNNFMEISIPIQEISELSTLPYIAFLELTPPPSIPDDTPGRSLHRANAIDTNFPSGRKYTGEGISVLTRDDGAVGPHIDFQGRISQPLANPLSGTHGDGVSGIFVGAGNLNPRMRGMAAGANLHVLDYDATFLDETMDLFFNENVLVTNSSYSNGCNAGYTEITETVDQQVYENPTLLHVFSAGNSNEQECGYGAGNLWGNITGGHKQGKNVIATANLFSDASLVNSSSRGPAHDGRIKPDISANGQEQFSTDPNNEYSPFGGTSAAAPGIAGITAMLHHAYQENNNGETANSALLKAILLNTANDLGNKGPDFKFGWGHVNAYRAALTIEENRFSEGLVSQNGTNQFALEIPEGVIEAKIMTYWMDQPGSVMTNVALVNNIDTWVESPAGSFNPWVLNSSPHPDSLDLPASTGNDFLNNMEQVAIQNPAAGSYILNIEGTELPFGDHPYYVVWEFRYDEITVTYPIGGERMAPLESERIYWDAEGTDGEFMIEYSSDNGANWEMIAIVTGSSRWYNWQTPESITGEALIRISRNGVQDQSDTTFSLMWVPENVQVSTVCPNTMTIIWSATPNASSFDIYLLGDKYMELVGTSTVPIYQISIENPFLEYWIAVSANTLDGAKGRRTIAIHHTGGLMNCQQVNDVAITQIIEPLISSGFECESPFEGTIKIEVINNGVQTQSDVQVAYQIDNNPPVVETIPNNIFTGQTIDYTFSETYNISQNGIYNLKTWTSLDNETSPYDDTLNFQFPIYLDSGVQLDLVENFETLFPSPFWTIENPDNDYTWSQVNVIGKNGEPSRVVSITNYNYDSPGAEDSFFTLPMDFSNVQNDLWLYFDLAYAPFPDRADGLRIDISLDCGNSFSTNIYEKSGDDLGTTNSSNYFTPNEDTDWITEGINLNDYIGFDKVMIRFTGINDFGNNIYIDNINVRDFVLLPPVAQFEVTDLEPCRGDTIFFTDSSVGELMNWYWNFGSGGTTFQDEGQGPHELSYILAGNKEVRLIVTNPVGVDTFYQNINVRNRPSGTFTSNIISVNKVSFNHDVNGAFTYFWEFGDGNNSNEENPIHIYDGPGDYTVTLTVANDCGFRVIEQTLIVSTAEIFGDISLTVSPNPNNGVFEIFLENLNNQALSFDLINLEGKLIQREFIPSNGTKEIVQFNQPDLPAGLYFVKIQEKEKRKTIRIIVE